LDWDDQAERWDEDEAVRAYADAAFASLRREADRRGLELRGNRALDFGTGTGLLVGKLHGSYESIDAVDTSAAMRAVLRRKVLANDWSHVHVFESVPPAGPRYDLVTCSSVCAFLDDYPAAVEFLADRLAPGGLFVQWDWEVDPDSAEPFGLARPTIIAALRSAGLEEVSVEVAFTIGDGGEAMSPLMGSGLQPGWADSRRVGGPEG
jgi:predicted TPR repeat methyltransferase